MKDFREVLAKQNKKAEGGFRMFDALEVSDRVSLSVQGSSGHYCQPREVLPPSGYSMMELAVFLDGDWANHEGHNILTQFPKWQELRECGDGQVFGYVDVELINELYNYFLNLK